MAGLKTSKLFIESLSFYRFYYSLRQKENERRFSRTLLHYLEHGQMENEFMCSERVGRASSQKYGISTFESIDLFIEEHSSFSDLDVHNFRSIFQYYALICSLVFVAFCVHHLVNFVKKRAIILPSPLRRCFARFVPARARRRISQAPIYRVSCTGL